MLYTDYVRCSIYEAHINPTLDRSLATHCFNGALNVAMCLKYVDGMIVKIFMNMDELWMSRYL